MLKSVVKSKELKKIIGKTAFINGLNLYYEIHGFGRPTSRLAILPGMTHYDILTFPFLAAILVSFLDAPTPANG